MIKAVLFDFGGVVAEEGFKEGMKAIGKGKGLDPDDFYKTSSELVYQTGYITGKADERTYWKALREKTGIKGEDQEFREEILKRFQLRPEMIEVVETIKSSGLTTAILSDQTNWLDELDQRTPFHHHFDYVFNSFHLNKTKKDPSVFKDVCALLGVRPEEALFVDDNLENVKRAMNQGLRTIHFKGVCKFRTAIRRFVQPR